MGGVSVKPVFYVCGCGCKVQPERIVRYRRTIDGQTIQQLRCPKHKDSELGRVISNICRCETCGKIFEGRLAAYCPECRLDRKKENHRVYMQTYYKKKPDKFSGARDKSRRLFQVDGQKKQVNCPLFGPGEHCGKICIDDHFPCSVLKKHIADMAEEAA